MKRIVIVLTIVIVAGFAVFFAISPNNSEIAQVEMPSRDGGAASEGSEPPIARMDPPIAMAPAPPVVERPRTAAPEFQRHTSEPPVIIVEDFPMAAAPDRAPPAAPDPAPVIMMAPSGDGVVLLEPAPFDDDETHRIRSIYIATNRAINPNFDPSEPETAVTDDLGPLRYLTADISIPREHRMGTLESQMWLTSFLVSPDERKHVILQSIEIMDRNNALERIAAELASTNNAVLMYVHGFNTPFEKAARRAGQLSYDLSWDGPSVLFSWPTQGNVLDYFSDSTMAEDSIPAMKQTLRDLAAMDADRIIIVAHSMGTRIIANAIKEMSLSGDSALDEISMVVLAAPDINRTTFMEQIAPRFRDELAKVTLYASANDSALKASKRANGFRRIGDTTDGVPFLEGIDVIDASGVKSDFFSHTYFADNQSILTDIRELVHHSFGPSQRTRLMAVPPDAPTPAEITHWFVRPVRTGR